MKTLKLAFDKAMDDNEINSEEYKEILQNKDHTKVSQIYHSYYRASSEAIFFAKILLEDQSP